MTKVIVSEAFVESTAEIHSDRVFNSMYHTVSLLGDFPEIGSSDLPSSIKRRFGQDCRKMVVNPFDILYRYDRNEDIVYIADIIHQRSVH